MIKVKLDYKCPLCGHNNFYISPVGQKTISNDRVYRLDQYQLVCKKCSKTYVLTFHIEAI